MNVRLVIPCRGRVPVFPPRLARVDTSATWYAALLARTITHVVIVGPRRWRHERVAACALQRDDHFHFIVTSA